MRGAWLQFLPGPSCRRAGAGRYTPPMRWLPVLLFLIAFATGAGACERAPGVPAWLHDDDLFDAAAAVFAVRIVQTRDMMLDVHGRQLPVTIGSIRLLDTFKGIPPLDGLVRSPVVPGCVPALTAGRDYLLYVGEGAEGLVLWHGTAASRPLPADPAR